MCVKAIQIDETAPELYLRILALILEEERRSVWISYEDLAKRLAEKGGKVSEDSVRYHVKKLMHLGYLRQGSAGYEVTEKVLFLNR